MEKYIIKIISSNNIVYTHIVYANRVEIMEGGQIAFYNDYKYVAIAPVSALIILETEQDV